VSGAAWQRPESDPAVERRLEVHVRGLSPTRSGATSVYGDFFECDAPGGGRGPARGRDDPWSPGSDSVAWVGAPLKEGNEAEDNCADSVEFDDAVVFRLSVADGRAGICDRAVVPPIATGSAGGRGGGSISAVVLGAGGGVVVLDGWCSRVSARWPLPTPGETVYRPANTRTTTAAAATTAAPMMPAPTT
jgi:hypothetical protein